MNEFFEFEFSFKVRHNIAPASAVAAVMPLVFIHAQLIDEKVVKLTSRLKCRYSVYASPFIGYVNTVLPQFCTTNCKCKVPF